VEFINRIREMERLVQVSDAGSPALVVVWGRRRLGKSRLLTEWSQRVGGTYWVADESSSPIQRKYLAEELERVLPGFGAVTYPDWRTLLDRVSRDARTTRWRGPLIIDEFPYLVSAAPELPSVLQRWVDREKREGGLVLALSGSSQRMMMDSVLAADAPLYGRADQLLKLEPLLPGHSSDAMGFSDGQSILDFYTCWGGVPRYWELAQPFGNRFRDAVDELVLSPYGVLHDEVNRLLHLELPSAIPLRPILDAIGLGAHRISEIAGRLHVPPTSLSRGVRQLEELGYVRREVPYGEDEKRSKKALYRLSDPFLRLWFRAVAPHRGALRTASGPSRVQFLERVWSGLRAEAWEDVCRLAIPYLGLFDRGWRPAGRFWRAHNSEWDVVSCSMEGDVVILGECKSLSRPAARTDLEKMMRSVMGKTTPRGIGGPNARMEFVIFVPEIAMPDDVTGIHKLSPGLTVVDGRRVFRALDSQIV